MYSRSRTSFYSTESQEWPSILFVIIGEYHRPLYRFNKCRLDIKYTGWLDTSTTAPPPPTH